ncbi:uncharacterized protein LOC119839237 [Zerene cesonia]|uniref:uncharacterized protein LOC119839237 n=1 Tax=Zerene cesonia TaxID=33412 RepID=UPI0018E4E80E|nr:uncharacterized protein LOC119839237 [Zerene cesonia]
MQPVTKNKILDLQSILTKMSLEVCCGLALPEFGVTWKDVSRAVRNSRLPMVPASFARVLCRFASKTMDAEELADLVARLRLKLIATQTRTWHVITLLDPHTDQPVNVLSRALPSRVIQALRTAKGPRNMRPEVQIDKLGDLVYISVQMTSEIKEGAVLYIATPPGQPVAVVSSLHSGLLKTCVKALGYEKYEDANLNGRDVHSLLRIYNTSNTDHADHLAGLPEYQVLPYVTKSGVDYTGRMYDEEYVKKIIGPDPPNLSKLTLTSERDFFDPERLNKKIKLTLNLRSEDVARTLHSWALKGAISPTSELFYIFHKIKSNKITFNAE